MAEKKWVYGTTEDLPEPISSPQKSGTSWGRVGVAATKGVLGFPGAMIDLPVNVGNILYGAATGKQSPIQSNIVSEILGIPSPESVGEVLEKGASKYLAPETKEELFKPSAGGIGGTAETVAEVLPNFLMGGGFKAPGRAFAKTAAAVGTQKGLEQFRPFTGRFGPLVENIGFAAAAHALEPGLKVKNLEPVNESAYRSFDVSAPKAPMNIENIKNKTLEIDSLLRPTFEDNEVMHKKLAQIEKTYTGGMTFKEGKDLIQDLNEFSDKLTPTGKHYVKELKSATEADMKQANPELYKDFKNARDLYKARKKYEDAVKFLHTDTSIPKLIGNSSAAWLASMLIPQVGGYAYLYPIGKAIRDMPEHLSAFKNLIQESALARKYYGDIMKHAAAGNSVAVVSNLKRLGYEAQKNNIKLNTEGQVEQKPAADGFVYGWT